jgi:hypothetical protein
MLRAARAVYTLRDEPESKIARATYNDVRSRYVLVEHRREQGLLAALLRFENTERPTTRDRLRQLGFEPNASPERSSISWRRRVSEDELATVCDRLREALGDAAVLDLGGDFAESGYEVLCLTKLPTFWSGRFLLHVGGTRRCVIFDAEVDERDFARVFDGGRDEYYAYDFRPATE